MRWLNWLTGGQTKEGPDTEMASTWMSLTQRPIFSRAVPGKIHHSTISKVVEPWTHFMAVTLQVLKQDNFTAKFLKREGNCRKDLGEHWNNKRVSLRAKHLLLQIISLSFQFPCGAKFKKWAWQEEDKCRLCKALYPDLPAFFGCLGKKCQESMRSATGLGASPSRRALLAFEKPTSAHLIALVVTITPSPLLYHVRTFYIARYSSSITHSSH